MAGPRPHKALRRYAVQLARLTYTGLDYYTRIPVRELLDIGSDVVDAMSVREKVKNTGK